MKFTQSQQGMLVISNDSFLVGVLTGYCAANNLSIHSTSNTEPLTINNLVKMSSIILFDLRSLSTSATASLFQTLHHINYQYRLPICAIYDRENSKFSADLSWVNYVNVDDLISNLDSRMTPLIASSPTLLDDRRANERRTINDRRDIPNTVYAALKGNDKDTNLQYKDRKERFTLGPFVVDRNSYAVYYKTQNLALTVKEFKLFILLAEAHDHVCSTETIISNLWPDTRRANKSDLYQYMHLLRKKVEEDPDDPRWIQTVKGVGYSLNTNETHGI